MGAKQNSSPMPYGQTGCQHSEIKKARLNYTSSLKKGQTQQQRQEESQKPQEQAAIKGLI